MSATQFLKTDNQNTVGSSVNRSVADIKNETATGNKRSEYSLPVNNGEEIPNCGKYTEGTVYKLRK